MKTGGAAQFDAKETRELAKFISAIEARDSKAIEKLAKVDFANHSTFKLGITGPPGAGKSSLVDRLIANFRAQGKTVAIVAIDPSSPFSGGAVLGDRVRMQKHAGDKGVFIRSIGSRGAHGGLAVAARAITHAYIAYKFDVVIIETVGVGQSEFDIMNLADTTAVVLVPESGDAIQTLKAGLLEVADIFVVNKGDRDGARQMSAALESMVALPSLKSGAAAGSHDASHNITTKGEEVAAPEGRWNIPVVTTIATKGEGIEEFLGLVEKHREFQSNDSNYVKNRADIRKTEFIDLLIHELRQNLWCQVKSGKEVGKLAAKVARGEKNPYEAVGRVKIDIEIK